MTGQQRQAARIAGGLQLAALDGDHAAISELLDGLDPAALREVAVELLKIWMEAVTWTDSLPGMRQAVALDALRQAAMPDPR